MTTRSIILLQSLHWHSSSSARFI